MPRLSFKPLSFLKPPRYPIAVLSQNHGPTSRTFGSDCELKAGENPWKTVNRKRCSVSKDRWKLFSRNGPSFRSGGVLTIDRIPARYRWYLFSLSLSPFIVRLDLCQVYRKTLAFLFDRDNVDAAAPLFPYPWPILRSRSTELSRVIELSSTGTTEGAKQPRKIELRCHGSIYPRSRLPRDDNCIVETSCFYLPLYYHPSFPSSFRWLIKIHPDLSLVRRETSQLNCTRKLST